MQIAQIDFGNLKVPVNPGAPIDVNSPALTIGDIISKILPYIFTISGIVLLVYLIFGGFQLMTSGGDPKAAGSAKSHITNALVGFLIIFVAFWIVQIFSAVLGLKGITDIFK